MFNKLPETGESNYLKLKGVKAHGVRFSHGSIVIPACDIDGNITTLQTIHADGEKRFSNGGRTVLVTPWIAR
ncbi:[weak similarity to] primase domain protein [methanotrophic bacterial endosymbiont of Bathymodiolus sp.]|nr:[weak similarity to] primase domain protein [methanotrophic bacterial endosymbiont of Bathymodiolus sp.]